MEENAGNLEKYVDEDGRVVKHELYEGMIDINNLKTVQYGGATMGEIRQRVDPKDPLDKLDRVIMPIALIGVAFGLMLIATALLG